mgnify:CR=1 FL=1
MKQANSTTPIDLSTLPIQPGIYQFLDENNTIIYIGKAKNLKKRVSSYFTRIQPTGKLKLLVKKIKGINTIIVNTEADALLLENELIKKFQPRYNILLKDDKTYPLICIKKEPFPRIFITRHKINDGSVYFGPFSNVTTVKLLLGLIRELFPLRTCNLNLSKNKIAEGNYKPCLQFHIKNCNAPCIGNIDNNT